MYYKLGKTCVTDWGRFVLLQIRVKVVTNWGNLVITNKSKCGYELGQLLQIRTTVITKQGSYQKLGKMSYKLGQVLQIRVIITNWGITTSVELFWVFWGLRLLEFLYLLRAVKLCLRKVCKIVFLHYSSAYCTKIFFHNRSSPPRGHFWVLFGLLCGISFCISRELSGF